MSFPFDAGEGPIFVKATVVGPNGAIVVSLGLDTGSTGTMINVDALVVAGYDPTEAAERVQVTTGSGVELRPRLAVHSLKALGRERLDFPVVAHTLPPSAGVDGLLGLDFFRGLTLTIDFRKGRITLQ